MVFGKWEPRMRPWHRVLVVLLPGNSLVTSRSRRDNHIAVTLCLQPISEPLAPSYPAQKAKWTVCFMREPDCDTSHHINPLNAELNPICHLLALLRAHPILHISRIRIKKSQFSINIIISKLYLSIIHYTILNFLVCMNDLDIRSI
jgi:hypothetical protein